MGPYPLTALYLILLCIFQFGLAYLLRDQSWPVIIGASFLIGAFANHALFAVVHEGAHNLIFGTSGWDKFWGIIANLPQAFPSSIGFRSFHLIHHSYIGEYEKDADLANHWEAKLVGNSTIKKIIWYLLFLLVEALRPMRIKTVNMMSAWLVFNILLVVAVDYAVYHYWGVQALSYLILSTVWGVGLHPVGGRWIQEHYIFEEEQETYSYYGPLNKLSFNVGYHNEHHDLYRVPWVNLPKLKKLAPEFYDNLYAHQSWTKVLCSFLFKKEFDLYARYVRKK
jgi:sphingolipid delta-4 desaturase